MALWGSQNMAEGGYVGDEEFTRWLSNLAQYANGGPVFTPPENMGKPSDMELAYNSQFFSEGGSVLPEYLAALLSLGAEG